VSAVAPVFGVLAGLVGVADMVPYVRDTLRGVTRPHRSTWLVWAALAVVVCLSQRADGASWSLVMAGTQVALNGLVFALAIRRGAGRLTAADALVITVAGAGVIAWIVADAPIVATAGVVIADLVAAAVMTPKTYRDPDSETLATYAGASVGGALAAGAVGASDLSLLLYPAYYCVANAGIAVLIACRRQRLRGRRPCIPPSTARAVPVVAEAAGDAR
jgi:hypothetical protein